MIIKGFDIEDYLALQEELLFYFGKEHYGSEEELQQDFDNFRDSELYALVMKDRDYNIKGKNWKLCRTCGKPFLTNDKRSVSITCYREAYKRHSVDGKKFKGDFVCRMKYKAKKRK